jgi:chitin synthase
MSYYSNNQNNYAANPYAQHAPPPPQQHEEVDLDDYYGQNNASSQWDSRSAKSSHTMHSNYSTQPINKPYEQQPPMPAPYQQNQIVDYPPTHRVQFPGGFGGPQRTYTESSGFSSAREKLMKRRVRRRFTCYTAKLPTYPTLLLAWFIDFIWQSIRQVPLQNGNLVVDVQVPSHIVTSSEKSEEFSKMRVRGYS